MIGLGGLDELGLRNVQSVLLEGSQGGGAVHGRLVGAVVGLLITTGMASKNYSVHAHDDANLYSRAGSLKLMNYYDNFMNTHTQKVPKAKDNDSDSGGSRTRSSTHTSSSGRSHGGTSMKF